jgi:hypothetical protein
VSWYKRELEKIRDEEELSGLYRQKVFNELVLAHGALSEELKKLYIVDTSDHNDSCEEYLGSGKFAVDIDVDSSQLDSGFSWSSGEYRLRGYFVIDYYGYARQRVTQIDLTPVAKLEAITTMR